MPKLLIKGREYWIGLRGWSRAGRPYFAVCDYEGSWLSKKGNWVKWKNAAKFFEGTAARNFAQSFHDAGMTDLQLAALRVEGW